MAQKLGIKMNAYINDILVWADSQQKCLQDARVMKELLEKLGFKLNEKKCQLIPSQQIEWLGVEFSVSSLVGLKEWIIVLEL